MITQSANYISSIVLDGSAIGIVEFNYEGFILSNLTTVLSEIDRNILLNSLPPSALGGTGIGAGLLTALTVS